MRVDTIIINSYPISDFFSRSPENLLFFGNTFAGKKGVDERKCVLNVYGQNGIEMFFLSSLSVLHSIGMNSSVPCQFVVNHSKGVNESPFQASENQVKVLRQKCVNEDS